MFDQTPQAHVPSSGRIQLPCKVTSSRRPDLNLRSATSQPRGLGNVTSLSLSLSVIMNGSQQLLQRAIARVSGWVSGAQSNLTLECVRFRERDPHLETRTPLGVIIWKKNNNSHNINHLPQRGCLLRTLNLKLPVFVSYLLGSSSPNASLSWAPNIYFQELCWNIELSRSPETCRHRQQFQVQNFQGTLMVPGP